MPSRSPRSRLWIAAVALFALLGGALLFSSRRPQSRTPAPQAVASAARPAPAPVAATHPIPAGQVLLHPLAVAKESGSHAWTHEDAKIPAVIERISHNPEEAARMLAENDRIKRRQLVYRKEPVALLLDRARASGQPLTAFTLPGLDGQEVEVEVLETQVDGHRGAILGRVKGRLDSMACVGFSGACESFNILSPQDGLYIAADAREPGEVVLKEIDPAVYSPMACGGPLTAQN